MLWWNLTKFSPIPWHFSNMCGTLLGFFIFLLYVCVFFAFERCPSSNVNVFLYPMKAFFTSIQILDKYWRISWIEEFFFYSLDIERFFRQISSHFRLASIRIFFFLSCCAVVCVFFCDIYWDLVKAECDREWRKGFLKYFAYFWHKPQPFSMRIRTKYRWRGWGWHGIFVILSIRFR